MSSESFKDELFHQRFEDVETHILSVDFSKKKTIFYSFCETMLEIKNAMMQKKR